MLEIKGSAIVYGLVIMAIVSILFSSIITFIAAETKYSLKTQTGEEALHLAEAGIYYYRWYLAHSTQGMTPQQVQDFWNGNDVKGKSSAYVQSYSYEDSVTHRTVSGSFSVTATLGSQTGTTFITVTSEGYTTKDTNTKRKVSARFRRPPWSEYVLLSNSMIRADSGTDAQGKVFSNSGVHFDGVASNVVSSAVSTYFDPDNDVNATKPGVWTSWNNEYNSSQGSDVFLAGKSFPVVEKDFDTVTADLSYMKTKSQDPNGTTINGCSATGCYFDKSNQGRHIILKTDGTFDIRTVRSFTASSNAINQYDSGWSTYTIPNNGVIFVENNIWLEGTISNKKVTIASANLISSNKYNIYIEKDIRYANTTGTEILGIVSQNDIEVIKNSNATLRIDGALLAQEGRVGRSNYGNSKDKITIFGAIATNGRYGLDPSNGNGYSNRELIYDSNLLTSPPPYFPTGTQYLMDSWREY